MMHHFQFVVKSYMDIGKQVKKRKFRIKHLFSCET